MIGTDQEYIQARDEKKNPTSIERVKVQKKFKLIRLPLINHDFDTSIKLSVSY